MFLTNIQLYNYGIYKGLHNIKLSDCMDGVKNITLVGGFNGRGKTTLLDSIILCLYGRKSIEFITGKKSAYNKVLRDRINKSAEDKRTHIELTLVLDDEDETVITIKRSWQQKEKRIDTSLSVVKNGIEDTYLSENWEYYVEELIPFGIAKFFFFDNEKISQIADDEAFDKIKNSIKAVMGVTTIESLCAHIEKIRKEKSTNLKKKENTTLTDNINTLNTAIEEKESLKRALFTKKASLLPELEKTKDTLEQTEQDFWRKGGKLGFDRDRIAQEQQTLKEQLAALKEQALLIASNSATPICLCYNLALKTFSNIRLDEETRAKHYSLPIITEMYNELLAKYKSSFNETSDSYKKLSELAHDQLTALENSASLKRAFTQSPLTQALLERFINEDAKAIINKSRQIVADKETATTALSQLDFHLSSNAEKNDTIKLFETIKDLQAKQTLLEADISNVDEQIRSISYEKERLEKQLNKTLLKIAADADTSDENLRIVEYATMTLEVMQEFVYRLQAQKVKQLENNISLCFESLEQKQGIISSLSIDAETLDITLRDYAGGVLLKNQLSSGEKQMFAISILWGLAITSGYKLPVVIDTPMARLDSAHRSNFINKYLPNASSQVIVLSTDEEINGKYLDGIKEHVNASYTLVYDENEKCSSIKPGYFGGELK